MTAKADQQPYNAVEVALRDVGGQATLQVGTQALSCVHAFVMLA